MLLSCPCHFFLQYLNLIELGSDVFVVCWTMGLLLIVILADLALLYLLNLRLVPAVLSRHSIIFLSINITILLCLHTRAQRPHRYPPPASSHCFICLLAIGWFALADE